MSPRGVAIVGVRERLFEAAERLLAREGLGGLTNRALATEAGCAKGLLYNHFTDLDDFLGQLVLTRLESAAEEARALARNVGRGTVAENLGGIALTLLRSTDYAITTLTQARPKVAARVREGFVRGAPGLAAIEGAVTDYLEAEKSTGRLTHDADTQTIALALIGTIHHLLMVTQPPATSRTQVLRLVTTLLRGVTPGA